jgi:hypothetical protein
MHLAPESSLGADDVADEIAPERAASALEGARDSIRQTRQAVFPHHGMTA